MFESNITLIGMPGAGKSTVGIVLAKLLCKTFIDADLVIQNNDYAVNLENKTVELQVANQKLEEMANRDGLTGAFNKAFMHKKLDEIFNMPRKLDTFEHCIH